VLAVRQAYRPERVEGPSASFANSLQCELIKGIGKRYRLQDGRLALPSRPCGSMAHSACTVMTFDYAHARTEHDPPFCKFGRDAGSASYLNRLRGS